MTAADPGHGGSSTPGLDSGTVQTRLISVVMCLPRWGESCRNRPGSADRVGSRRASNGPHRLQPSNQATPDTRVTGYGPSDPSGMTQLQVILLQSPGAVRTSAAHSPREAPKPFISRRTSSTRQLTLAKWWMSSFIPGREWIFGYLISKSCEHYRSSRPVVIPPCMALG